MPIDADSRRDSRALEPSLIADPIQKAEAEARNGLLQFDEGVATVQTALDRGDFKLRPSLILSLHRRALAGISSFAGNWRPAGVEINSSKHVPPGAHCVPELVEDMCDYVNTNWSSNALHLAAYCMWRLNWIHPFADGNGRTSRIVSYVVLSIKSGFVLPGSPTIPVYIVENRDAYYKALDSADEGVRSSGVADLKPMEELLESLFAKQLASFFASVRGDTSPQNEKN